MDRTRALRAFNDYIASYDPANPRIALKVNHTLRVASLCERIARSTGLAPEDVELAWLIGLLHDIGRFEQVRRYDSFNDSTTVDHASLGAEVLFGEPGDDELLIRSFHPSSEHDDAIKAAVELHSSYRLPEGLDERTLTLCKVLRDADKVDIIKVNCVCPIEDIYGVSEQEMVESELTPACVEYFYRHSCIPRDIRQFPADIMLGHICFVWELCFDESVRIVNGQGYLAQMLGRSWARPDTQETFDAMADHLRVTFDSAVAD